MKKKSGTNINLGNYCSQVAFSWAKKTFNNRVNKSGFPCMVVDGAFSNIMDFNGVKIGISSDGIGTKVEIAERTGIYDTLGFDLMAMVVDDLVSNGIEPVNISNILDVDFLEAAIIDKLMQGLYNAANLAGVVITGGEIAELGTRIQGFGDRMHFNWCATGIGIVPHNKDIIDGHNVEPGDVIIALKSQGFRSNGFSMLRQILKEKFGVNWHKVPYDQKKSWGEILLTPSIIYTPIIVKLIKSDFKIKGIAHITGGGIFDNLSRVLKKNKFGAILNNLFTPFEFMRKIQSIGGIEEETAYRLWNMGNGAFIVVANKDRNFVINLIHNNGYQAQIAGKIIDKPEITIHTLGINPQIYTLGIANIGKN